MSAAAVLIDTFVPILKTERVYSWMLVGSDAFILTGESQSINLQRKTELTLG